MRTSEIREAFLNFFEGKGHTKIPSSSLIPAGDPTLLFANAGMVQFKDTFLGVEKRTYTRAATCQKCLRISGKHNDLENVGRTARHHTFFEMLGNFSFGDYFKEDAIKYAWEFVTSVLALPKERLWATVYKNDDEAAELWRKNTDIGEGRILRRGMKDNFWAMGDTGPCGPCSEIFYYLGSEESEQKAEDLLADHTSYLEIWNLVFMQFNRDPQGNMTPLPRPSVDTGMGLERVAAIKQGAVANYDSDQLRDIIFAAEQLCGKKYDGRDYEPRSAELDPQYAIDVALRVIADHLRATSFLIADGILPSSDGRGYVLRRLIRRACRHGRVIGLKQPFLGDLSAKVVELMGPAYLELVQQRDNIQRVIRAEEEKFLSTLDSGLSILEKEVSEAQKKGSHVFPGAVAFLLHDTYGFPLDLTEDIIQTRDLAVDKDEFCAEMEKQRERSRSARASQTAQILQRAVKALPTRFCGYDYQEYESRVLGLFDNSGEITAAQEGKEIALVAEETPFYAESGGQIGDTGKISSNNAALEVIDTQKAGGDTIVHICRVTDGEIASGSAIRLGVDQLRRNKLRINHSATHLLHLALREVLGEHSRQAGSRVSDASLRFDFTHIEAASPAQLAEIEARVNQLVRENHEVVTEVLPLKEAQSKGAMALFGEKYGELVRVVRIGPSSCEFCAGTHVQRSGDIGYFGILGESAVAAGVRRIEAAAGSGALSFLHQQKSAFAQILGVLNASADNALERVERLLERNRELERALEKFSQKANINRAGELLGQALILGDGTKVVTGILHEVSPKQLREVADDLRARIGSGCIALASVADGKPALLAAVTPDLSGRYHAGRLLKEIVEITGSRGGGNAELAQAGGGDAAKFEVALAHFRELLS